MGKNLLTFFWPPFRLLSVDVIFYIYLFLYFFIYILNQINQKTLYFLGV